MHRKHILNTYYIIANKNIKNKDTNKELQKHHHRNTEILMQNTKYRQPKIWKQLLTGDSINSH